MNHVQTFDGRKHDENKKNNDDNYANQKEVVIWEKRDDNNNIETRLSMIKTSINS